MQQRGMVTVELAMASLGLAAVLAAGVGATSGVLAWAQCQVTANEVARQAARGDAAGVARARADAPPGAAVTVTAVGGATVVEVTVVAEVGPLSLPLTATARVLEEG